MTNGKKGFLGLSRIVASFAMIVTLLTGVGDGFTPTTVSAQDTGNPRGYCDLTKSGRMALTWDGTMRIWMADELASLIKTEGGTCVVVFDHVVVVTMNSIEGAIKIDGACVKNGNGLLVKGQKFEFVYFATAADGFDLWLDFTHDPATITNTPGTKCGTNGNTGPQELPMDGATPTTTPASGSPTPTNALASGSCTDGTKTWTLGYDETKGILYMDNFLDQIRQSNANGASVTCTLTTTVPGVVEIHGQTIPVNPGTYTYTWNANAGSDLGFNWKKTS